MTQNPFEMLFGGAKAEQNEEDDSEDTEVRSRRAQIARDLQNGKLESQWVTIEVSESMPSMFDMMPGMDQNAAGNMQDMLSSFMPKKKKKRKISF